MKKKIGILSIILLIFIIGVLLYFSNGSTIPAFGKGTVSLEDYYHSVKADFHYVKADYEVEKDDSEDYPILMLVKGDKSIKMQFLENYSNAIEKDMYLLSEDENIEDLKEVKYGKYKGYYYRHKNNYSYVMLILDCVESPRLTKDTCTSIEFYVNEEFTKDVEDIIRSISFSKFYHGSLKINGVISTNHKYAINRFNLNNYKVDVYKMESGINVEIFNDEELFLAEIREGNTDYIEAIDIEGVTLYDTKVDSDKDNYKELHTGYFNKGIDLSYKFYSNVDEDLYKEFVKDIIKETVIIK